MRGWVPRVGSVVVAAVSFALIATSRPHHMGGRIEITVAAVHRTPVLLRWDSGDGFNELEQTELTFGRTVPLPHEGHRLSISCLGEGEFGGDASMVLVRDIILDGLRQVELASLATPGDVELTEGGLLNVLAGGNGVHLTEAFSSLEIVLAKGPFGGKARIDVDDDAVVLDLHETYVEFVVHRVDQQVVAGTHVVSVPLPRSDLLGIELEPAIPGLQVDLHSVRVVTDDAVAELPVESGVGADGIVSISTVGLRTRSFSLLLIVVQLLVATLLGATSFVLLSLPRILGKAGWRLTLRVLTMDDQRWVWWLMCLATVAVFGFWLAGQWPGAMQNDSFAQWTQLKTLEINNVIPWLYTMVVLAATQIADTPAIIGVLQIVVSAVLGSSIFFFAYRAGVSRAVIAVFWFLFTFSIPIGLYNVTIFKDVPFAQCTLLWAFLVYRLWMNARDRGPLQLSAGLSFVLALLLMGFLVRHNGFLFVFGIPLLIMATGLLERRSAIRFAVFSWVLFAVLQLGVSNLIGAHGRTDYARLEFWMKAGPVFGLFANPGGYHTDDPEGDQLRMERFVGVETIKREYRRGSFEPLFYQYRLEDSMDVYRDLSALYDERVAGNAPILTGDKTYLFTTIIGPFREAYLWSNDLIDRRFLRKGVWWNRSFVRRWGDMTMLHYLAHSPRLKWAFELQDLIWNHSRDYAGLVGGRFVYWNAVVPLALLVFVAAAYKWLPGTALFSLIVLFQIPFVFLAATAYHYRFIFFVHFCGFFVVPLALAEIRAARHRAMRCEDSPSGRDAADLG